MLKIKKQIPFSLKAFDENEFNKNQEEIKNSIKKLYIGNQSKKKTIDEYAQLTTQIREEYAKLQAKCVQLENTLQKYKDYIENRWNDVQRNRRDFRKPLRKTKIPYYRYDNDEREDYLTEDEGYEDESDYYTREGTSKPKRKKRIVYVDEIDGDDNNEGDEAEEVEEVEEPEVVTKIVKRTVPTKKKI